MKCALVNVLIVYIQISAHCSGAHCTVKWCTVHITQCSDGSAAIVHCAHCTVQWCTLTTVTLILITSTCIIIIIIIIVYNPISNV